ncbi:hypothetical protein ESCO_000953 [Escovopsis weberi]|uniref:Uncharacterized protein n=1 Tax=Escovopsis weberi TaxID=150374 RepID=A0A0N0RTE7_ESCWE|nr:hypothetical protein ESCO_000953 [Escovopsis weberi]
MKGARMQIWGVAATLGALLSVASAMQIVYIDQLRAKAAALQGAPHPEVAAFGNMAQAFILQLEEEPAVTAPPVHVPVPVSVPVSTVTVTVPGPVPAAMTMTMTVTVADGECAGVQPTAPVQEAPRVVTSAVVGYAPPPSQPSGVRVQETAVVTRTVMRITTVTCEEELRAGAATTMSTRTRGAGAAAVTEPCDG